MKPSDCDFSIGDRIQCEGYRGIILFVGTLPCTSGVWLGVDWDDPARGKHNGTHNDQQYFTTKFPTSGSFVRPQKVQKSISFCQALQNKYGDVDESSVNLDINVKEEVRKAMKASLFETVGFDKVANKQSNLCDLTEVDLSGSCIHSAGLPMELVNTSPNIRILNLSSNLLKSWEDVAEITQQLPHLRTLDLKDNVLETSASPEKLAPAFLSLKTLTLTNIDWPTLLHCSQMWPQLEQLVLRNSGIKSLTPMKGALQKLRILDFSDNDLEGWETLNYLGELPCLEELLCANVGLKHIVIPSDKNLFLALRFLSIPHNQLSDWQSVSELNKLPTLENLRISHNESLAASNYEARCQLAIARIASLKILDGRVISPAERRGAEIDYLKKYGQEYLQCIAASSSQDMSVFLKEHPRYMELIQKYGPPEAGEVGAKPASLASNLLSLTLRCDSQSTTKRLPRSMSVQKLKALFKRSFRVSDTNLQLVAYSVKNPALRIEMDNDLKELDFFSLSHGDVIEAQ